MATRRRPAPPPELAPRPTALGAYIFAGGFTVGVKRHFDVLGHLEGSDYGVPTARLNWPDLTIRYPEKAWADDDFGSPDFVYANPPCAIFSPMGIVTTKGADSWKTDPRCECWRNALRLFDRRRPKAFALESVPQAYSRGREMIDDFTRFALERGYSVTHLLLDAKWTGIPQSRKRFFIVFHRQPRLAGYQFNYAPPPTVGDVLALTDDPGYFTVHSRKDWPALIEATPQGERLANTWETLHPGFENVRNAQGKVTGRPSFQDRRLRNDEVMGAWVGDKFYHPTETRAIGMTEGKALCGYPPEFQVAPSDVKGWGSLLARAVMPPVGEWLARAVATTLSAPPAASMSEQRVYRVDVREPDVDPVDLTSEYVVDGRLRAPATTREIEVAEEEEYGGESDDGGPGSRSVAEVRAEGERARDDRRTEGDPGQQVVRGHGAAARPPAAVGEDIRIAKSPEAPPVIDLDIATIVEITGIEEKLATRIARAFGLTSDPAAVVDVTGADPQLVRRVYMARRLVIDSPAGRPPAAPAAQVLEEPTAPSPGRVSRPSAVLDDRSPHAVKPAAGETSRARAVKPAASPYVPGDDDPKPKEGEGSGAFIRRMLMADAHAPEQIVGLVLANFEGRKTTVKDVAWNWNKLNVDGAGPPAWRGAKTPGSYPGQKKVESNGVVSRGAEGAAVLDARRVPARQPHDVARREAGARPPGEGLGVAGGDRRDVCPGPSRTAAAARPLQSAGAQPPAAGARVDEDGLEEAGPKAGRRPGAAGVREVRGGFVGDVRQRGAVPADGRGAEEVRAAARAAGPLARVAIVEWFPRVCGSVTFGYELSKVAPGLDRITFSRSGKPLAGWSSPWPWAAHKIADASAVLSRYDGVFLVDVACFAPEVNKTERPFYVDVLENLDVPTTGMFHGGLYPKKHDPALAAILSCPGFTGSLLTTRLAQARERFADVGPTRFVHHPFLPYDFEHLADVRARTVKRPALSMTARIATNKGQNAALALADLVGYPVEVSGYNAFGFPSIAYRLIELGNALGYDLVAGPALRRDHADLTHPNAHKFYTGAFEFRTPTGNSFRYVDAYDDVADADWSPWLHASLPSRAFGDTLEYVTLDAVAAGSVAIVPETSTVEADYRELITVPYEGCSVWSNDDGDAVRGKDFDRASLAKAVNGYLGMSGKDLKKLADLQLGELRVKHAADRVWAAVGAAFRGEGV